ncbi:MAG: FliA/WhiG family RNA polymerase sigma factor [Bryobacteraceae bacterium]|nr:FliA/WhiG family RNA polymerase sigma factor [Bryobacteraceae bacterium]
MDRDQLILEHLPQVRWIAASLHERLPACICEEDLVSTGVVGLIQAIDNYDPGRNASLKTYAGIRIRGAILDSIRGLDGVDPHKRKQGRIVQQTIASLEQTNGRSPSEEEIAEALSVSLGQYQQMLSDLRGVTLGSLDSFASEDHENGLLAFLADPRQEDPGVTVEKSEMRQLLADGIRGLPETERLVIDLYFSRELTLAEIGRVIGLHLSRVSQLKVQAILRLRSFLEFRLGPRRHAGAS